jgi:hypothetical protein
VPYVRIAIHQVAGTSLTILQVEGLLFWGWLGGYKYDGGEIKAGRLLTIEELGQILNSKLCHRSFYVQD